MCIINFQSVNNKKADILHLIDTEKPDIIAGSETWLNSTVSSSEIFRANYNVYRSDRTKGSHGRALLAIKAEYTAELIETSQDVEAVLIKMGTGKGKPRLIIGPIYRPTNNDLQYSTSLSKHKKASFWLCGDFNLPDVSWESRTIIGHQHLQELNLRYFDMPHNCGMSQMVEERTREQNIFLKQIRDIQDQCLPSKTASVHYHCELGNSPTKG